MVTEKMKEAGAQITSDLWDAEVSITSGGLGSEKTWDEFIEGRSSMNLDLVKQYVSGEIDSVTAIYIAMARTRVSDVPNKEGIGSESSPIDLFGGFDPEEHDLVTMDGYDDCIVGVVEQFGRPPIVCYSKSKVLSRLMQDGMTEDEAEEFWSFNQIGAWVGGEYPVFSYAEQ
jgi:hypothetical protein